MLRPGVVYRDARVYGHKTTGVHDNEFTPQRITLVGCGLLRPGIAGMRGSMVTRLRACMTTISPPPRMLLRPGIVYRDATGMRGSYGHATTAVHDNKCTPFGGPNPKGEKKTGVLGHGMFFSGRSRAREGTGLQSKAFFDHAVKAGAKPTATFSGGVPPSRRLALTASTAARVR